MNEMVSVGDTVASLHTHKLSKSSMRSSNHGGEVFCQPETHTFKVLHEKFQSLGWRESCLGRIGYSGHNEQKIPEA